MPGLYIPSRTSSSSSISKPAGAPFYAPPSSFHHRQAAPAVPTRPAFQISARSLLDAAASRPIFPAKEVPIQEQRDHGTSSLHYSSSGSLHIHDPSLALMVNEFLEKEEDDQKQDKVILSLITGCGRARCNCADGVCGAAEERQEEEEEEPKDDDEVRQLRDILESYTSCASRVLVMEVEEAMEELRGGDNVGTGFLRRGVMRRLCEAGYNAAACKSRWNFGDGIPAGDYEYIDVIMESKEGKDQERLMVDIDFKAQFEIARPSREYARMLNAVPKVFVGRAERVKEIVKMLSKAAKRSLNAQGLMTPPWRKYEYMQAKWLSPTYRRTTKMEPARHTYKESLQEGVANSSNLGYGSAAEMDSPAICPTSWQLPCLQKKPSIQAPLVSALSRGLQQQRRQISLVP